MARISVCWLNRHAPTRNSASWDGENYVSTCGKCGKSIRRLRKGVWKLDWTHPAPQMDNLPGES